MLKEILIIATLAGLTACASLTEKVSEINNGDSKDSVVEKLGTPQAFQPLDTPGAEMISYHDEKMLCSVGLFNNAVIGKSCVQYGADGPSFGKRLGAAMGTMGQSMQRRNTHCTSSTIGNVTSTDCN